MRRALALLLLLAFPAGAEQIIPSVPLGAPGLDLVLTLRLLEGGATTEEDQDTDDVVVVDHGDGSYGFSGLPDAGGRDRYTLLVATEQEPTRHLGRWEWGAEPGVSVLFRNEIERVGGYTIVEDDTAGAIQVVVRSGFAAAPTSATFTLADASTRTAVVSGRPAVVSNVTLDANTGSYGATFTYFVEAAASNTPGTYLGEFAVTMPDGTVHRGIPKDTPLRITVRAKL
jgi:hypothetical protein